MRRLAIAVAVALGICAPDHAAAQPSSPARGPNVTESIPGYTYGDTGLPRSPVTLADLELLQSTLLFTDEDRHWLRQSSAILEPRIEEILDVWYGFVGSNPHLLASFVDAQSGQPDSDYLAAVRKRFGRWILDTARAEFDQAWLDYQAEIGRRHHRTGKNRTDGAQAAAHIPARYVLALSIPITVTLKPFLQESGRSAEEVDAMHAAWTKAVWLQSILWVEPYMRDGDF
jgi:hypothetical protein